MHKPGLSRRLELLFELLLWNSRLVVLIPVIASLAVGVALVVTATADVVRLGGDMISYATTGDHTHAAATTAHAATEAAGQHTHEAARADIIARVVEMIDGYLLAMIMLIFSFGLYELFISRIDFAEQSEFAKRVLLIQSFDDLKDRLAKVVLLVLVVKFFEHALRMSFDQPLDLLYLAIGVALIATAILLTSKKSYPKHAPEDKHAAAGDHA